MRIVYDIIFKKQGKTNASQRISSREIDGESGRIASICLTMLFAILSLEELGSTKTEMPVHPRLRKSDKADSRRSNSFELCSNLFHNNGIPCGSRTRLYRSKICGTKPIYEGDIYIIQL